MNDSQPKDERLGGATVTCKIDCLSGGRIGLGVYTDGVRMTEEGAGLLDALMDTLQSFSDANGFQINVRRGAQ